MENFRNYLGRKIRKYMDINRLTYKECATRGVPGLESIVSRGSTYLETLFNISKLFDIDVRNLLLRADKTYIFKDSFKSFNNFYLFLGYKFKKIRTHKGITAKNLITRLNDIKTSNPIYSFENGREVISIKKLYEYIDALGLSPEEFFLADEEYEIAPEKIDINKKNKEEFYTRLTEVEKIRGKSVGSQVNINPNKIPTLHIFLNICKSLKIHPKDFLDYDKKQAKLYRLTDINVWVNLTKNKMNNFKLKSNRYIELDEVFCFCNENNIKIKDFFNFGDLSLYNDTKNINYVL